MPMVFVLSLLNRIFDLMFRPLETLAPLWVLLIVSVVTGLLLVLAFRFASDQKKIRVVKDRVQAHVLEVRLFRDEFRAIARAYGRLLRAVGAYLRLSLKPLLVLLVPLILVFIQIDMRLGWRPLEPNENFIVKAKFADAARLSDVALRLPAGLMLTAPPVRVPADKEIAWRVSAQRKGRYEIAVAVGDREFAKQVVVDSRVAPVSARRVRARGVGWLLEMGEAPLPSDAPLQSIEVRYLPRAINFGLIEAGWVVPFFVFSLLVGYAAKGLLGAEI